MDCIKILSWRYSSVPNPHFVMLVRASERSGGRGVRRGGRRHPHVKARRGRQRDLHFMFICGASSVSANPNQRSARARMGARIGTCNAIMAGSQAPPGSVSGGGSSPADMAWSAAVVGCESNRVADPKPWTAGRFSLVLGLTGDELAKISTSRSITVPPTTMQGVTSSTNSPVLNVNWNRIINNGRMDRV
jgi:hypothetical protein